MCLAIGPLGYLVPSECLLAGKFEIQNSHPLLHPWLAKSLSNINSKTIKHVLFKLDKCLGSSDTLMLIIHCYLKPNTFQFFRFLSVGGCKSGNMIEV